jgi:LacI family transcriptional regulator
LDSALKSSIADARQKRKTRKVLPTSADVAQLAGVSRATVSNVINGTKFVGAPLVERVLEAVRELNYQPHAVARSLAARRTHTVGFLVPMISSTFYPVVISAAEKVLAPQGYSLLLCDGHDTASKEAENLELLAEKRVDGLIWVPCSDQNTGFVRRLAENGTSVVVLDRKLPQLEFPTVASNNLTAGRMAADYLLGLGYRRMAILVFSQSHVSGQERLAGFRGRLSEAGIGLDEDLVCVAPQPEFRNACESAAHLVRGSARPQAIFACSDVLTLASLQEISAAGLRIPDDIALLGFDDSPWNKFVSPPLTVITQDKETQGRRAAQLLVKGMTETPSAPSELIEVPVRLISRASCGELARGGHPLEPLPAASDSSEGIGPSPLDERAGGLK